MSRDARSHGSLEEVRAGILKRLRARRSQIDQAIFIHLREAVPDSVGDEDAEYTSGLGAACTAGVDYSLMAIEHGRELYAPIPAVIIEQARRAARSGVSLETVMLRVTASERVLRKFAMDEADHNTPARLLDQALGGLEAMIHRLMATLAEEYHQEHERMARSPEQQRAELVMRQLGGEILDPAELRELGYGFDDVWHLGVIATGTGVEEALRLLKAGLGCEMLLVSRGARTVWAWLGSRRRLADADIKRLLPAKKTADVSLAVGESRREIDGWRQTHQEAQAALPVALRKPPGLTRCTDVLLEAALLQNPILARLLVEVNLSPLDSLHDGGQSAREALGAYIECNHNLSSTGHKLKVHRHTVASRLEQIEEKLCHPLHQCLAELEVALRLEALGYGASADGPPSPE